MRVGIVLSETPGYSETFFRSKITGLQSHGIEVVLYCQKKKEGFDLCPVVLAPRVSKNPLVQTLLLLKAFVLLVPYLSTVFRYARLERKEGTSVAALAKKIYLNSHLLKAKLEWLHFGFATQALGSETVAKAIGAKMAASFRGFDLNVYPTKHPNCYDKLWKHVDKVHSISKYLLEKAIAMGLSPKTPSQLITPAVQMERLPTELTKDGVGEPLQIVTVARLAWIKGIESAVQAMAILKDRGIRVKYTIIGEGSSYETERCKYVVHQLGLEQEVLFLGKCTHEATLRQMAHCDIYLQPSLNEGFCNAVLEAQALGKLCMATRTGGLPENIMDRETGFLFDHTSPESLVAVIEEVNSLSPLERKQIAERAKTRVEQHFNIALQQEKFKAFYTA